MHKAGECTHGVNSVDVEEEGEEQLEGEAEVGGFLYCQKRRGVDTASPSIGQPKTVTEQR